VKDGPDFLTDILVAAVFLTLALVGVYAPLLKERLIAFLYRLWFWRPRRPW
jgi:hypothetical protein